MPKKQSFEEKIEELETIVKKLESDTVLDEAVDKYERGIKLVKDCQNDLKKTEQKIMKLVEEDNNINIVEAEKHEFPTLF